jgi:actin-related protein
MTATIFTGGDFIRRVVDSLLRGDCRGKFLCSRCLVKMAKDHLDRSYTTREVVEVMDEIFKASDPLTHAPATVCAACARKKVACLGAGA